MALVEAYGAASAFSITKSCSDGLYDLPKKPGTALGLVNPNLNQAGGSEIAVVLADFVGGAQPASQFAIVGQQLGQHVPGGDKFRVVVAQTLVAGDIANGMQSGSANLAGTLGDDVGHGENLTGILVEEQMIIAKMPAAHVPVEVLRLQIEGEGVGEELAQVRGNLGDRTAGKAGGAFQGVVHRFCQICSVPHGSSRWRLQPGCGSLHGRQFKHGGARVFVDLRHSQARSEE